jgi:hypothetical protein
MHTYRYEEKDIWTVGFDACTGDPRDFTPLRDFTTEAEAAAFASYLNGGERRRFGRENFDHD